MAQLEKLSNINFLLICKTTGEYDIYNNRLSDVIKEKVNNKEYDINLVNKLDGNTALHYLCQQCDVDKLSAFFSTDRYIDINITNNDGCTPIMLLFHNWKKSISKENMKKILNMFLPRSDLMPNIESKSCSTAYDYAIIRLATFYTRDPHFNKTMLDMSVKYNHQKHDIVQEALKKYNPVLLNTIKEYEYPLEWKYRKYIWLAKKKDPNSFFYNVPNEIIRYILSILKFKNPDKFKTAHTLNCLEKDDIKKKK